MRIYIESSFVEQHRDYFLIEEIQMQHIQNDLPPMENLLNKPLSMRDKILHIVYAGGKGV